MKTQVEESIPDLSPLKIEDNSRSSGNPTRHRVVFVAIIVPVLFSAGLLFYYFRDPKAVVEVAVAQPAGDARAGAVLNASGYVTPRRRATVAAKITGRVISLYVEEGMRVTEGQVLAILDDSDARVRLNSARADREASNAAIADLEVRLADAERELKRSTALQASGIQTVQALDQVRTTAESLRAQGANCKLHD